MHLNILKWIDIHFPWNFLKIAYKKKLLKIGCVLSIGVYGVIGYSLISVYHLNLYTSYVIDQKTDHIYYSVNDWKSLYLSSWVQRVTVLGYKCCSVGSTYNKRFFLFRASTKVFVFIFCGILYIYWKNQYSQHDMLCSNLALTLW